MKGNINKNSFMRSKSGNDYNDKGSSNKLRGASSLQSIVKSGGSSSKGGMRKFRSNARFVEFLRCLLCLANLSELAKKSNSQEIQTKVK